MDFTRMLGQDGYNSKTTGGSCILLRRCGGDGAVIHAARICTGKTDIQSTDKLDQQLLEYMMIATPHHGTPFEHAAMSWEITTPIFVARQLMRHRMGTFNEQSMRYTAGTGGFYTPSIERVDPEDENSRDVNQSNIKAYRHSMHEAQGLYRELVEDGWPRELARGVLGTAMLTHLVWSVNAGSFMNWIEQRAHRSAQWEHRELAAIAWKLWSSWMPKTAEAFYKMLAHSNRTQDYEGISPPGREEDG